MIKPKIWDILNVTLKNKKITMSTSTLKSQKTSNGLGDFYTNDWQKDRGKIRKSTLYWVSHDL